MSDRNPNELPSIPQFDTSVLVRAREFAAQPDVTVEIVGNEVALLRFLLMEALELLADPLRFRDVEVASGREPARPRDARVRALENALERFSVTSFGHAPDDILANYFAMRVNDLIGRIDSNETLF